jgi:hypothetical protein
MEALLALLIWLNLGSWISPEYSPSTTPTGTSQEAQAQEWLPGFPPPTGP